MTIRQVGAELFIADGKMDRRADRQADMKQLTMAKKKAN
jgi:hypothetical protein